MVRDWVLDLRNWRVKCAVTQEQLAEIAGVSVYTVRAWEQGRRQPPPCLAPALKYYELTSEGVKDAWL